MLLSLAGDDIPVKGVNDFDDLDGKYSLGMRCQDLVLTGRSEKSRAAQAAMSWARKR
jgi:hypothetical protein